MRRRICTLLCSMLLLPCIGVSQAATTINFLLKQVGQQDDFPQTAYIDNGKILIQGSGGGTDIDLLFQQSNETMTVINHSDRTTLDIDAEKVAGLANQAQGMMSIVQQQMAKQMENMSEQEREKFKEMVENLGGGQLMQAPPPPPPAKTYKEKGTRTINGYTCTMTEIFEGNNKVSETCTAQPTDIGLPPSDYEVIVAMQSMAKRLQDETAKISGQMGQSVPQFGTSDLPGVPVLMQDREGNTMTVTSVEAGIGNANLNKPDGYAPKQMPSLPQLTQ